MGLFGKLFEKKECSICGGEIGLLGNRKLEDGNMCKNCAAELSPWFSDRRNSTVQEIEAQLEYRRQNREKLNDFRATSRIGENYKMFVEEIDGVPMRFVVCWGDDWRDSNPDIIDFKDVGFCNIDIRESRDELEYTNDKNERVSYNPPRYEYSYDFYVDMGILNNPYFDDISFKINSSSVTIAPDMHGGQAGRGIGRMLADSCRSNPDFHPEYRKYKKMCDEIEAIVSAGQKGVANVKFEEVFMDALGQIAAQAVAGAAREMEPVQQQEPVQQAARPNFCPNCGAAVSGGKFCANCGNPL